VRHATDADLDRLEPLLGALRDRDELKERRRGAFVHRSRAFLHFHGHGEQLYADVRLDGVDFERWDVTTAADQARLLAEIDACLHRA
jgi:hypothetical protein